MYAFKLLRLKIIFILLLSGLSISLEAQSAKLQREWWFPNGPVNSIAADTLENKIYIGGSFDMVGPAQPYGAVFSLSDSAINSASAIPDNPVITAISDGKNGWFVAGKFQNFGDSVRPGLVHLNSKGKVTPLFSRKGGIKGAIAVMYVKDSLLFLGGSFSSVMGISRNNVACINIRTGNTTSWAPEPDGAVFCFALHQNSLHMGGDFTSINGTTRFRLAAVDINSGQLNTWNPSTDATVKCMAVYQGMFYVAGSFTRVNGSTIASPIILIDSVGKTATSPTINFNWYTLINCLRIRNGVLYVGGKFDVSSGGNYCQNLISYSLISKKLINWRPSPDAEIQTLEFYKNQVVAGGDFITVADKNASRVVFINDSTGQVTAYSCPTGAMVRTIALSDTALYIGGDFFSIGGMIRHNLARFDAASAKPDPWDPAPNGSINKILPIKDRIFVAGDFSRLGIQSFPNLVALTKKTGTPLNWKPVVSHVEDMLFYKSRLYICGSFYDISSQARKNIGCVDTTFGYAFNWAPNASNTVSCMTLYDDKIYAGGSFNNISGAFKANCIAVLNPLSNGTDTSVNSSCYIKTIYTYNGQMFVGFYDKVIRVNPATGTTIGTWNPAVNFGVNAISEFKNAIILGGGFSQVSGKPRAYLAMVSGSGGTLLPWNPAPNGIVSELSNQFGLLFCGGSFTQIAKDLRQGFAVFKDTCVGVQIDTTRVHSCGTYFRNSIAYTVSTTIKEQAMNEDGCPVMHHILLTVSQKSPDSSVYIAGCREAWHGSNRFTKSGTYLLKYTNQAGCDSNIIVHATMQRPDNRIYFYLPGQLASYANPATYQWYVCDSAYTIVPGATSQIFEPSKSGSYGVFVTYNNCTDTSFCLPIAIGATSDTRESQLNVFPNPTNGEVQIQLDPKTVVTEVKLRNSVGSEYVLPFQKNNSGMLLDLSDHAAGTYFLTLITSQGIKHFALVKN